MPGFIKPQLATLKSNAPKGEQWFHEIKYEQARLKVCQKEQDGRDDAWLTYEALAKQGHGPTSA